MYPEIAISLFGTRVAAASYEVFCALAALAVVLTAPRQLKRAGLGYGKALAFTALLLAAFFVGARLWNRAVYPESYGQSLGILSLRFQGFSLYGGGLAAGLALVLLCAASRCGFWAAADALVLPAGAAFCLARMGCFLGGCCGGVATNSALGVAFPPAPGEAELLGKILGFAGLSAAVKVWPTQLFELSSALLGLAAIPLARKARLAPGSAALLYLLWFTAARWAILPLRALPYETVVTGVVYPALYGGLLLLSSLLLLRRNRDVLCKLRKTTLG